MQPMWTDWVLPRLRARGLGDGRLVRTLRTHGIGESNVVERLGEEMLRGDNPIVATYARADWLDIRISAVDMVGESGQPVRPAAELLDATVEHVREALAGYVWAEGETTWADLVTRAAAAARVRFSTIEAGTRGQLGALLSDVPNLERAAALGPEVPADRLVEQLSESAAEAARTTRVDVGLALCLAGRASDSGSRGDRVPEWDLVPRARAAAVHAWGPRAVPSGGYRGGVPRRESTSLRRLLRRGQPGKRDRSGY